MVVRLEMSWERVFSERAVGRRSLDWAAIVP